MTQSQDHVLSRSHTNYMHFLKLMPQHSNNCIQFPFRDAHHLTVTRLAFRPHRGCVGSKKPENDQQLQLASCGSDHAVRVYSVDLNKL